MSHKTTLFIFFVLVALAMASGCAKTDPIQLSASDNGKTVNVKTGDQIVVTLDGNPTTGYNWEAKDLDTSLLKQQGDPSFKSSNSNALGSGGSITLTFKSLNAGTTTLTLVYHRSWETDVAPLSTYTVTIVAK